jgi:MerR family transcriptional regulator/heat shock protein HspR
MYSISQAAQLLNLHSQTLRNWEKHGLIKPQRFGQVRIYSEKDIEQCQLIKKYAGKGIALAGIKKLLWNLLKTDSESQGGEAA